MAFLNENEWILLNEIAYNISFIYTVEEMQQEMLNRWLPFLIPYDAAIFARISTTEDGAYQFRTPAAFQLSQQAMNAWVMASLILEMSKSTILPSRFVTRYMTGTPIFFIRS